MLRFLLRAGLLALAGFACAPSFARGASPPVSASAREPWIGPWHGTLDAGKRRLRLQLTIGKDASGLWQGQLESLDQAPGQGMPLSELSVGDDGLRFSLPAKGIRYEGTWEPEGDRFVGTFRQGAAFPLAFARGPFAAAPLVQGLDGAWEGTTLRNGVEMRMALRVGTGNGGTVATFDAPDMLAKAMPVTALARDGDRIRFTLPTAGVSFAGRIEGEELSGRWTDGSRSCFRRTGSSAEAVAPRRPQTPRPPFPYRDLDASIPGIAAPGVTLSATLSLPDGDGPFPAAILITGSGPQDRDESAFGHKPFAVLADHLARRGIAVLRYDDRGVGRSTGRHAGATSADFANDANAAFAWLAAQPGIDANAIGFIGHSEGGIVGPLAALDNPKVAWMVLLAAPGVPIAAMLEAQRKALAQAQGRSAAEQEASEALQAGAMRIAGSTLDEAAARSALDAPLDEAAKLPPAARDAMRKQALDPWFRWFVRHDPAPALARFPGPILALNGALDRQVLPRQNLEGIRAATASNRDAATRELAGLNHLFQTARTGGLGEYAAIEETMSPLALDAVSGWIVERYPARTPASPD